VEVLAVAELAHRRLAPCAESPEGTLETAFELLLARQRASRQLRLDADAPWGALSLEAQAASDAASRFLSPLPSTLAPAAAELAPLLEEALTHLEDVRTSEARRQRALVATASTDSPDHLLALVGSVPRALLEVVLPFALRSEHSRVLAHVPAPLARWVLEGSLGTRCQGASVPSRDSADVLDTCAVLWEPGPVLHASLRRALEVARAL
jgi:hypothetical protein